MQTKKHSCSASFLSLRIGLIGVSSKMLVVVVVVVVVAASPFLPWLPRPAHPYRRFLRHRHPLVRPLKPLPLYYTFDVFFSRCLFQVVHASPVRGSAASATPDPPGAVGNPKCLTTLLLEIETTIGIGFNDNRSTDSTEWPMPRRIDAIERASGIPASNTNAGEEFFAPRSLMDRIYFAADIFGVNKNME